MDFITDFFQLTFKRKLFVFAAMGAWYLSIKFSKIGFGIEYPDFAWIGWGLGVLVTIMELALNDREVKTTATLVTLGLIAYGYGIYTNVTGIWYAQNVGGVFGWGVPGMWMAVVVGGILELMPEPLIMLAYGRARDADPLGILSDLISGKLLRGGGSHQNQPRRDKGNDHRNEPFRAFAQDEPITEPKINTSELFKVHKTDKSKSTNPRWKH